MCVYVYVRVLFGIFWSVLAYASLAFFGLVGCAGMTVSWF